MCRTDVYKAVENMKALNKRDAAWHADRVLDAFIEALQRDPALPPRSYREWSVALADLRPRVTDQLASMIVGCVDLDTVLDVIAAA